MNRLLQISVFSGVLVTFLAVSSLPGTGCGPWFPESLLKTPFAAIQPPRPSLEIELEKITLDIPLPGGLTIPSEMPLRAAFDDPKPKPFPAIEKTRSLSPSDLLKNENGCRDDLKNTPSELAREIAELAEILDDQTRGKNLIEIKSAETVLLEYRDIRSGMYGISDDPILPPIIKQRAWPVGLPEEFTLYLNAAAAFRDKDFDGAQKQLETLLSLPAEKRKHRSIWASFLLGRIELARGDNGLVKSISHFRNVLSLYEKGFHDALGMRWDSLKCIADHERYPEKHDEEKVMKYYFALARAGQPYCLQELKAMVERCDFEAAAKDPVIRQIVTAVQLGNRSSIRYWEPQSPGASFEEERWLTVLESTDVTSPEANRLAWLAYDNGSFDRARRWLRLAGTRDEIGCWVEGKLALQSGSPSRAKKCLTKAEPGFPRSPSYDAGQYFEESGSYMNHREVREYQVSQYWGDLGLVRLANNDFTAALDALMRSGYWHDAAYVAEQLLSREELLSYVRRTWPEPLPEKREDSYFDTGCIQNRLRYLTARRLARDHYFKDARQFFPKDYQPVFDHYVKQYRAFRSGKQSDEERAQTGWGLAQFHRSLGMELFGTELGPDWFCLARGNYSGGAYSRTRLDLSPDERLSSLKSGAYRNPVLSGSKESEWEKETFYRTGKQLDPTSSEMWRFRNYAKLDQTARFHYRYDAADLAWEASLLTPSNTDLTAKILNTAGSWIAVRHPAAADVFYKSLVIRNRNTLLGMEADVNHWFATTNWNFDPWKAAGVSAPRSRQY